MLFFSQGQHSWNECALKKDNTQTRDLHTTTNPMHSCIHKDTFQNFLVACTWFENMTSFWGISRADYKSLTLTTGSVLCCHQYLTCGRVPKDMTFDQTMVLHFSTGNWLFNENKRAECRHTQQKAGKVQREINQRSGTVRYNLGSNSDW